MLRDEHNRSVFSSNPNNNSMPKIIKPSSKIQDIDKFRSIVNKSSVFHYKKTLDSPSPPKSIASREEKNKLVF